MFAKRNVCQVNWVPSWLSDKTDLTWTKPDEKVFQCDKRNYKSSSEHGIKIHKTKKHVIDVNAATKCLLMLLIYQTVFCNLTQWQAIIHHLEPLDQKGPLPPRFPSIFPQSYVVTWQMQKLVQEKAMGNLFLWSFWLNPFVALLILSLCCNKIYQNWNGPLHACVRFWWPSIFVFQNHENCNFLALTCKLICLRSEISAPLGFETYFFLSSNDQHE